MQYTKMNGLGNDYVFVFGDVPDNVGDVCRLVSDRARGIGSDGMIFISRSSKADFSMRVFNSDGSEALMCGNGIRCVGKYVYEKGLTDKTAISVETLSGVRHLLLHVYGGKVDEVIVEMGKAEVSCESSVYVKGREFIFTPVSTGNPHAVIFVADAAAAPVECMGKEICFLVSPGGVNVEFVSVLCENTLRMRVWERGSGVTSACGTGACAAAAAACEKGLCEYEKPISVILDGGKLEITVSRDRTVRMKGPAVTEYDGEIDMI